MFRRLLTWLFPKPDDERLRLLARTSAAMQKRDSAIARRDDRDLGRALMELRQCQIERLELGC